ncbi:CbiX/SirB N-terminal domain-containing protein [Streptomyces sp. NPDC006660]|uniref:sirohydrochlorin chelatase n=1 Tax=Streptomyces sp. NPDC006660 TaxID=3156901 RepID=UPI0033D444BF
MTDQGRRRTDTDSGGPALVAVAHGSRDPGALRTVDALLDRVRALRPDLDVRLGNMEIDRPALSATLAQLRGEAVLVPLLLGRGHHVKHDIPHVLATAGGHLRARVAAPLGPHPLLAEALHARLIEAGWPGEPAGARATETAPATDAVRAADTAHSTDTERAADTAHSTETARSLAVVLAAAGSRDPAAAAGTRRTARLLSARLGGVPVVPAYASAASPTVPDALRALAARGRHRVAIAAYFTAPGGFAAQCAAQAPWVAAAPLGAHPAMAELVLRRYAQELTPHAALRDPRADSVLARV